MSFGRVLALIGLIAFWGLALAQPDLPGLYYDEAADAAPAVQLLAGKPVEPARDVSLDLFGRRLPVMVMDYVGAVSTYLYIPWFGLLGVGVLQLRILPIAGGMVTLALAAVLGRRWLGSVPGGLGVLLGAIHPSFVFWTRQGVHVSSLLGLLAMASLLSLDTWLKTGRLRWAYLTALLFGLGLSVKLLFLWWGPVLGLYLWVRAGPKADQAIGGLLMPGRLAICLLGVLIGAWMPVYYNLRSGGTLEVVAANLWRTSYGVENWRVIENLATAFDHLLALVRGDHFWFLGGRFGNPAYPPVLVGSLGVALAGGLVLGRRDGSWRLLGGLGGIILLVTAQSAFTVSGLWPTHLYLLMPIPQLLAVGVICRLGSLMRGRAFRAVLVLLAGLGLGLGDLAADLDYHRVLAETGGWLRMSDAIYRLADYLAADPDRPVFALDWGIAAPVVVLTGGRITPVELFFYQPQPPPELVDMLYGYAGRFPTARYLFHAPEATVYDRRPEFERAAAALGRRPVLEFTTRQRDGKPIHLVYRLE
ncbi:MAG: hypothetical protein C4315_08375 [Chloroflexota bacterium]